MNTTTSELTCVHRRNFRTLNNFHMYLNGWTCRCECSITVLVDDGSSSGTQRYAMYTSMYTSSAGSKCSWCWVLSRLFRVSETRASHYLHSFKMVSERKRPKIAQHSCEPWRDGREGWACADLLCLQPEPCRARSVDIWSPSPGQDQDEIQGMISDGLLYEAFERVGTKTLGHSTPNSHVYEQLSEIRCDQNTRKN